MIRKSPRRGLRLWCFVLFWFPLACVPGRGGWDASVLPHSVSEGSSADLGRITDGLPGFVPEANGLSLFLCRWPKEEPIPVWLSPDARPEERRLWEMALHAWESAGLGISFSVEEKRLSHGIHVAFPSGLQRRPAGTGDALADCRIQGAGEEEDGVNAHLSWASIHLNRSLASWKGVRVPLDELLPDARVVT